MLRRVAPEPPLFVVGHPLAAGDRRVTVIVAFVHQVADALVLAGHQQLDRECERTRQAADQRADRREVFGAAHTRGPGVAPKRALASLPPLGVLEGRGVGPYVCTGAGSAAATCRTVSYSCMPIQAPT